MSDKITAFLGSNEAFEKLYIFLGHPIYAITPRPTETRRHTVTPRPTETRRHTVIPRPTETRRHTVTPRPTEMRYRTMMDAFDATLESVVDHCPGQDTLLVLGDFNASSGTDRDGYETCFGPHGSGTVNQNSTKLLDIARSHGLGWLFHGFSTHRLIAGLGIPMLVMWQRRLTMCSFVVAGG